MRDLAGREHRGPDGQWVPVGRSTLDRWIRNYWTGGFDALIPKPRSTAVVSALRVSSGG